MFPSNAVYLAVHRRRRDPDLVNYNIEDVADVRGEGQRGALNNEEPDKYLRPSLGPLLKEVPACIKVSFSPTLLYDSSRDELFGMPRKV